MSAHAVVSLPGSPYEGLEVDYHPSGSLATGPVWRCVWRAAMNSGSGAWVRVGVATGIVRATSGGTSSVGYAKRTAGNQTIGTTRTDLTGMTVTFDAVANRLYRATWMVNAIKGAGAGQMRCFLTNGSNTVLSAIYVTGYTANAYVNLSGSDIYTQGSDGSVTLKLRGEDENANGTWLANTTQPCVFIVEDIGARP